MSVVVETDGSVVESVNIIPRSTIENMVRLRDIAIEKYSNAYGALGKAQDAIKEADAASNAAAPNVNSYNYSTDKTRRNFLCKIEVSEEENFSQAARRLTDIGVWSHIIEMTELESVMDKEEKDKLRKELHDDPPEITVDNIYATLQRFVEDSDTIWKRGVANCFSKLDRRFRSHGGWKIGSRVILDNAFSDYGSWNYYRNHQDTLVDIERAFFIIDGKRPPLNYSGIVAAINHKRGYGYGTRQTYIETDFFKCRIYKNGNCHIWFLRDDLLEKVNLLLADYYGEVLANDREKGDESGLRKPKTSLAKNFGHFPTPPEAAKTLIDSSNLHAKKDGSKFRVLEPSAGGGNIARLAAENAIVDCVEIQHHLAKQLGSSGLYNRVFEGDFLSYAPNAIYDRVLMNPPFDMERDIDHVMHAMEFLKPDGMLVAIMSAGTEFRETKKSRAFRDHMKSLNAAWRDLPAQSFSEVGTNVNTIILRVRKNGLSLGYWSW